MVASLKKLDAFHSISCSPQQYHSAKIKLSDQLLKCLTDRFEDDQEILKATLIDNMKPWPKNIDNEPVTKAATCPDKHPAVSRHSNCYL